MGTYEETDGGGRKIGTMRHFRGVPMDRSPRVLTYRKGIEPIAANHVDHAPRWQYRLGSF